MNINKLLNKIEKTHQYFSNQALKQVNISLTLRNFVIGYYIFEYEQSGKDRAKYGKKLFINLAESLSNKGIKGFSERSLYLFKEFYKTYPQILQTVSAELKLKSLGLQKKDPEITDSSLLIKSLSFSHFIELIKIDSRAKRAFYEIQSIKNNWSTRELKRSIDTLLYERIGLSTDKELMLERLKNESKINVEDIIKNPYVLEFLNLQEKSEYSESDLEQAIINHLQQFLIEMGRGFCFEARQKRITFNNTHYRVDLVFYHRILKCHILVDLKLGEFDHSDAGQMNLYLNYYKEKEMHKDDNPPIGIILCAGKDNNLVKYATGGMSDKLFVSKYLVKLPKETELEKIIFEEQEKLEKN
jgi:predicted nuclease of restriction endonuclease-like (RecB) superfamily